MIIPGKGAMKFFRMRIRKGGQRSPLDKVIFEQRLKRKEGARHGDA